MFFDGDVMQSLAGPFSLAPGLPGGEEVEAEAEADFEDDETLTPCPTRRQIVAAEKDVA